MITLSGIFDDEYFPIPIGKAIAMGIQFKRINVADKRPDKAFVARYKAMTDKQKEEREKRWWEIKEQEEEYWRERHRAETSLVEDIEAKQQREKELRAERNRRYYLLKCARKIEQKKLSM